MEATATAATTPQKKKVGGRSRSRSVDYHVGARMRERRAMLGLTQQQMAELIGVTYQQAHKYETGINRIACSRLKQIADALGVEPGWFFEGLEEGQGRAVVRADRRMLDLASNFMAIRNRRHQDALCALARTLADADQED